MIDKRKIQVDICTQCVDCYERCTLTQRVSFQLILHKGQLFQLIIF